MYYRANNLGSHHSHIILTIDGNDFRQININRMKGHKVKKPIKIGLDWLVDKNWKPKQMTRTQLQRFGDRQAKKKYPKGFWNACIFETDTYFRLSFGGDDWQIHGH
jgi:hypothetical protein